MADSGALETRITHVLEDPGAQSLARVYAEAFLNAAGDQPDDAIEELTSFMDDVLRNQPEFESILFSGILRREDKSALIDRVITPFASARFNSFLQVLVHHDRLTLLPAILQESILMHEDRQGKRRVQIKSAQVLPEATLERIRIRLTEALPFEPILETSTDPTIIGGIVIQVGDTVYDSSLRNRMKQLRKNLRQRSLYEIQSGRDRFSHPEGD